MTRSDLEKLYTPFDKIKTKRINNKILKYLETEDVVSRLNDVFNGLWNLDIKQFFNDIVIIRISVDNIIKEAFGFGINLESAVKDALNRAASLFGIGLALYDENNVITLNKNKGGKGMDKDKMKLLYAPFDTLEERTIDGKPFKYVRSVDIINRLNNVLDGNWSFYIDDYKLFDSTAVVKVRLTVDLDDVKISKGAFGSCSLDYVDGDIGNGLKVASSDGLKKAAMLFGVGLDVNTEDIKPTISGSEVDKPKKLSETISEKVIDDEIKESREDNKKENTGFPSVEGDMISDIQKKAIINSQKTHGGDINEYIFECLGEKKEMDELTYDEAVRVIRYMSEASKKKKE